MDKNSSREEVIKTVEKNGAKLKLVNPVFKKDKEVVLAAIKNYGGAFNFASDELKQDYDVVYQAISSDAYNLKNVSLNFQNNKELVSLAVKSHGSTLKYASKDLQNDKEIVMLAIKQEGMAIEFASNELKSDREIVTAALQNNIHAFEYIDISLYANDIDIMSIIVSKRGEILHYASEELKNNKSLVFNAVRNNGDALKYASNQLKNDIEIVLEALNTDEYSIEHVGPNLLENEDNIARIVKKNPLCLDYLDSKYLTVTSRKKIIDYLVNDHDEDNPKYIFSEFPLNIIVDNISSINFIKHKKEQNIIIKLDNCVSKITKSTIKFELDGYDDDKGLAQFNVVQNNKSIDSDFFAILTIDLKLAQKIQSELVVIDFKLIETSLYLLVKYTNLSRSLFDKNLTSVMDEYLIAKLINEKNVKTS